MRIPVAGSMRCAILLLLARAVLPVHAQEKAAAPAIQAPTSPKPMPEVQALLDRANALGKQYKWTDALRVYEEALSHARTIQDRPGEATALNTIGLVYNATGQPKKGLDCFRQALSIFRADGDRRGEANATQNLGAVYNTTGDLKKALELFQQALKMFRDVGEKRGEANALNNCGLIYTNTGQPEKALELHQQALPIYQALRDRRGEANALQNLGTDYYALGQPLKALDLFQQTLPIYQAIGDKSGEANALNNMGVIYRDIGRTQKALELYQQALPLFRSAEDKAGEATALNTIGNVYAVTGQPEKALDYYQQALTILRAAGDKIGEAAALGDTGLTYRDIGQPKRALEFYRQALQISRSAGDRGSEANGLLNIGLICTDIGQPEKAVKLYQQALTIFRTVGDKRGEASSLGGIGVTYRDIGQPHRALELFQQALQFYRAIGDKTGEADELNNMGVAEERLMRLDAAETHFRQAMMIEESLRADLGGYTEAKSAFLAEHLGEYHRYLGLLLRREKLTAAFAVAQHTKARALLDLVESGRVDLSASLSEEEREQLDALHGQANFLNAQMVKQGVENGTGAKARFAAYAEQLKQVESKLQALTDALYARHPELARKHAARTTNLADLARFLPSDTALLDYVVIARNEVRLFVVTAKQGKATLHAYPIRTKYVLLEQQANAFHVACADPRKTYQQQATALYQLLIAPAEKDITGRKRLLICPDQALWNVPFAALMPGSRASLHLPLTHSIPGTLQQERFLADRFEIDYAYSATGAQTALQAEKRTLPTGTILTVANPDFGDPARFGEIDSLPGQRLFLNPSRTADSPSRTAGQPARQASPPSRAMAEALARGNTIASLPGTKREADAILMLFPDARLLTGTEAQEATVKQQAGNYRYLHLATHGFLNDAAPLLSSIVLAKPEPGSKEDGFLTAREVFDLNLNAELVVLSSCNSGRGQVRTGEGIVGLTWAFFAAGAPTQVVSQWSVDDAATAQLMAAFYQNLKTGGSKGSALHDASLSLLRGADPKSKSQHTKFSHPYYWAPFTLVGDWR